MNSISAHQLGRGSPIKIRKVSFPGMGPLGMESIEFCEGVNVLTGINGSGKSIVLRGINDGLRMVFSNEPVEFRRSKFSNDAVSQHIVGMRCGDNELVYSNPSLNRAFVYDVHVNNVPHQVSRNMEPDYLNAFRYVPAKTCPLVYISSERGAIQQVGQQPTNPLSYRMEETVHRYGKIRLLFDLIHDQPDDFDENLNDILARFFPKLVKFIKSRNDPGSNNRRTDIESLTRRHEIGTSASGCIEILFMVAETALLRGSVILIDEPELHLHPLMQDRLAEYFNYLASEEGGSNQVILATHGLSIIYGCTKGRIINLKKNAAGVSIPAVICEKGKPTDEYEGALLNLGYSKDAVLSGKGLFKIFKESHPNVSEDGGWMNIHG